MYIYILYSIYGTPHIPIDSRGFSISKTFDLEVGGRLFHPGRSLGTGAGGRQQDLGGSIDGGYLEMVGFC